MLVSTKDMTNHLYKLNLVLNYFPLISFFNHYLILLVLSQD